ncbi:MAG: FecR family protein [bacterium]
MGALLLCGVLHAARATAGEAGWVAGINGAPTIVRGDKTQPLQRGDAIAVGDRIRTGADAKVKVLLADDSVLAIGPQSDVVIDQLLIGGADRTARLRVLAGRFKLAIAAWFGGASDYEVATPTAIAGVRGTVLWGDTELDAICDLHGTVQVRTLHGAATTTLEAGRCVTGMAKGDTTPLLPSPEDLQRYLRQVTLD